MAASLNKFLFTAALALCACGAFAVEAPPRNQEDVQISAGSGVFDYRNNTTALIDVIIKQGDLEIKANEAHAEGGIDSADNLLTLRDKVRITTADSSLQSDRAEITIRNKRVSHAVVTGSPATFERLLQGKDTARGRAGTIEYQVGAQTVRFQEGAYFNYGGKDIRAPNVVYNLSNDTVLAEGGKRTNERVHITIKSAEADKPAPSGSVPAQPEPKRGEE